MRLAKVLMAAAAASAASLSACSGGVSASPEADRAEDACINPTQIREQTILSDTEIQFTMNSGEVWLNRLPRTCPGLKFEGGFTWEVRGTLVCSNEQTIYTKTGAPCQLGAFSRAEAPS